MWRSCVCFRNVFSSIHPWKMFSEAFRRSPATPKRPSALKFSLVHLWFFEFSSYVFSRKIAKYKSLYAVGKKHKKLFFVILSFPRAEKLKPTIRNVGAPLKGHRAWRIFPLPFFIFAIFCSEMQNSKGIGRHHGGSGGFCIFTIMLSIGNLEDHHSERRGATQGS